MHVHCVCLLNVLLMIAILFVVPLALVQECLSLALCLGAVVVQSVQDLLFDTLVGRGLKSGVYFEVTRRVRTDVVNLLQSVRLYPFREGIRSLIREFVICLLSLLPGCPISHHIYRQRHQQHQHQRPKLPQQHARSHLLLRMLLMPPLLLVALLPVLRLLSLRRSTLPWQISPIEEMIK